MSYTLPPWSDAEAWQSLLKQFQEDSGSLAVSLHIVRDFGDVNYAVGDDGAEEEDDES